MPNYKCQLISASKLILTFDGSVMPLCNSCGTKDCTNNVIKKDVAIFGLIKSLKLLMRHNEPYIVIMCEGFSPKTVKK